MIATRATIDWTPTATAQKTRSRRLPTGLSMLNGQPPLRVTEGLPSDHSRTGSEQLRHKLVVENDRVGVIGQPSVRFQRREVQRNVQTGGLDVRFQQPE